MVAGLIILFLFAFLYGNQALDGVEASGQEAATLVEIFEKSGADILESSVTNTLELPYNIWNRNEILCVKEELKRQLNLQDKLEIITNMNQQMEYIDASMRRDEDKLYIDEYSDNNINQIVATNMVENGDVLGFKVYSGDLGQMKSSYIIIDIIHNKGYKGIVERCNQSREILQAFGNEIETTINIVGTYEGQISDKRIQAIIDKILLDIRGKIIEEVEAETYRSLTIYTPLIQRAIEYDSKRVNLHLAIRYNEYENKTYLYIANPLITLNY